MDTFKSLQENAAGIFFPQKTRFLSEDAKLDITEQVMEDMFKFISNKYNSLDFSEIEKSAGDITKFKYRELILDNLKTLEDIYKNSTDSDIYSKYVDKMKKIIESLIVNKDSISYIYGKGNGMIQMFYISSVAAVMYGISTLVTLTVKFVTSEDVAEIEVLFDDVPNPTRYTHLKNIDNAYNIVTDKKFGQMLDKTKLAYGQKLSESIGLDLAVITGALNPTVVTFAAIPLLLYMSTKIVPFIREVIYTIYYSRVQYSNALEIQLNLLRTNIESLERGRGTKKIIATQKKYVVALEKLREVIMVKNDRAAIDTKKVIDAENKSIVVNVSKESGASNKQVQAVIDSSEDLLL